MANYRGFDHVTEGYGGQLQYHGQAKVLGMGEFHGNSLNNSKETPYTWLSIEVIDGDGNPLAVDCMDFSSKKENIPADGSIIAVYYRVVGSRPMFTRTYAQVTLDQLGHNKIVSKLKDKIDALKASIDPDAHEAAKAARGTRGTSRKSAII